MNDTSITSQSPAEGDSSPAIDAWLAANGIKVSRRSTNNGVVRLTLACSTDPRHEHSVLTIYADRTLTYQCSGCNEREKAAFVAWVKSGLNAGTDQATPQAVPRPGSANVASPLVESKPASQTTTAVHTTPVESLPSKGIIDGLRLFNANFPDLDFIADDILALGLTIVVGRPKTGKSWLALQLALAVSSGERFLKRFDISKGKVLYAALEEPRRRTHSRLHTIVNDESHTALADVQFIYDLPISLKEAVDKLDQLLALRPVRLLIIDTYLALLKTSDARGNDILRSDYKEIDQLRQLAERHGTAILLVHHTSKRDVEYGLDAVAGTTGVTAACDAVWVLERQASGKYLLNVTGREIEEQTYGLRFDGEEPFGWKLEAEGAAAGMGPEREQILALLRQEPLTPLEIALRLSKPRSTIRNLLRKIANNNLIMKGTNGKYVALG